MKLTTITSLNEATKGSKKLSTYAAGYFAYLKGLMDAMDMTQLDALMQVLSDARSHKKTVFIAGNGGSAATASHMAADWVVASTKFSKDKVLRAVALTNDVIGITACANDKHYDDVFKHQLEIYYQPGDVLIVISASGNSQNLLEACSWVKEQGGKVIALLGFDGGQLLQLCDTTIHVKTPTGEYGPVEDLHMIIDHLVYSWMKRESE